MLDEDVAEHEVGILDNAEVVRAHNDCAIDEAERPPA